MAFHVSKIKNFRVVAECSNGLEALEVIQNNEIDVVFSDIDMPELSGLGLVKSLKNPPVFVFITSYADYAVESFNLDVIDFIVKPASFERVLKAANKAIEYIELKKKVVEAPLGSQPKTEVSNTESQEYFYVKDSNGHLKINYADVVFIESMGDFSKINTLQSKMHVVLVSLKNITEQLPVEVFMRVHKQFIVNVNHVVSVAPTEIFLSANASVPLSSSYKADFMEKTVDQKTLKRFG
jgi:DNA-binding LytR/AlgR family response regulator